MIVLNQRLGYGGVFVHAHTNGFRMIVVAARQCAAAAITDAGCRGRSAYKMIDRMTPRAGQAALGAMDGFFNGEGIAYNRIKLEIQALE